MQGFNLPKHMAEHIYMYSGESITVKFMADTMLMNDLVDWFGRNFSIVAEEDNKILVSLKCNENAMFHWALQYGGHVEIKEPLRLRARIREAIEKMATRYKETSV